MKFKVNSQDLVDTLRVATKGHDSRDTSSFLCLEIVDNKLKITSQCQSAFFTGDVDVDNLELTEDEVTNYYVDGEVLKKLMGVFPTASVPIQFYMDETARVFVISYTGSKFKLPVVSDTMALSRPEVEELGLIQATEFMDMLNSLLKIVDTSTGSQSHPTSCLHLIFNDKNMTTMATDRFAIAELTYKFTGSKANLETNPDTYLIKLQQANLLNKNANPAEVLKVLSSKEYLGYEDGDGNISLVGRTNLTPLNYAGLKSQASSDHNIVVNVSDLKDILSTISKVSFSSNTVILELNNEDNSATLSSQAGDTIVLPIVNSDMKKDKTVTFTRSILQEALIPLSTDKVKIEWSSNEGNPIYKFTPLDNKTEEPLEDIFVGVTAYVG